jgi:hypothetical protein
MDNRFGVTAGRLTSVGRSINYGWDGAFELDLIGLADKLRVPRPTAPAPSVSTATSPCWRPNCTAAPMTAASRNTPPST